MDVVQYLKNNELFLSHGYCPECVEKMIRQWFGQEKKEEDPA
ncbi:MAG: hypothetical protein A4E69_02800 [Syntrophus sp. PtaB.Bin138]|nr:MAG: hypothetical protein A4E69_02800 [Syntrophus sp. PtaB.Bin138]